MGHSSRDALLIGVVGPCGSGKSTLVEGLETEGYRCRHIAQEHSYVPHMWQRITDPDLLIYLGVSFDVCTARRRLSWMESDYLEQLRRLSHAREHADLLIATDDLTPLAVLSEAIAFIRRHEADSAAG